MAIITGYSDVFAPRFLLTANGAFANDLIPYISKFTYEDAEGKADKLILHVINPGLKWKDDPRFREGARFSVRFGYLTDVSDVKNAVISKADPIFADGMPMIEMVAFNLTQDMNKKANPFNYGAVSSSQVAQVIAQRYNFKTDVEESQDVRTQARVQPAGMTDIQYLYALAHKLNWDAYIEGVTLHFHHKRFETPPEMEFVYFTDAKGTLLRFKPNVNMKTPPVAGITGADGRTGGNTDGDRAPNRRQILNNDTSSTTGALIPGRAGPTAAAGQIGLRSSTPEGDPRVVALHGAAMGQRIDQSAIKAEVDVVGTPRVRARMNIRISGVDQQYTGMWRVSKSVHTIDAKGKIYVTKAHLRRDAGMTAAQLAAGATGTNAKASRVKVVNNNDASNLAGTFSP